MRCTLKHPFFLMAFCLIQICATAQDARLRLGAGVNFVANNFDESTLNSFATYSLNTSYTVLQQQRYLVVWEQNILLRNSEADLKHKRAFAFSVPLSFRFQPGYKMGYYIGFGPTYMSQRYDDPNITQRVRGWNATAQAGLAYKTQPIADALFVEYHLKAGVHHSLNGSGNMAPFITLAVQLGANQRVERLASN